jgi:peptidoglycan hydrolase FlgJ
MSSTFSAATSSPAASQLTSPAQMGHLKAQAKELEGVFLNTLMKEMFSSVKGEKDLGGGGFGEDTWRDMQAEQMANTIADAGGIGLADALMGDLLKIQEASQASNLSIKGIS